jgi:hypothetical protein
VGSNPTPSARNGHFPRATVCRRSRVDDSFDDNQRAATSTGLVESAGARRELTSPGPRVCPGVAAVARDGCRTRPGRARRPLATVSARVARRDWAERIADKGERAGTFVRLREARYACPPRPQSAHASAASDGTKFRLKTTATAPCLGRIPPTGRRAQDFTAERDACTANEGAPWTSDQARALILRFSAEGARWHCGGSSH